MESLLPSIVTQTESYFVVKIIIACFVVGYLLKNHTKIDNNYIPLIMVAVGMVANVVDVVTVGETAVTIDTLLSGSISGLASSGFYDLLAKSLGVVGKKKDTTHDETPL